MWHDSHFKSRLCGIFENVILINILALVSCDLSHTSILSSNFRIWGNAGPDVRIVIDRDRAVYNGIQRLKDTATTES